MIRSPLRSPLNPVLSAVVNRRRSAASDILAQKIALLFSSGEQGIWYDPSDFSTMFQDSAGTTPVTAVGQPVGKILDKSGRGNHATQATATARPVLQQDANGKYYLAFDGVDDSLATASAVGLNSPSITSLVGIRFAALPTGSSIWANSRYKFSSASSRGRFTTLGTNDYDTADGYLALNTNTVCGALLDSGFDVGFRKNGVALPIILGSLDAAFAEASLIIGAYAGAEFLNGRIYSLIVRGALSDAAQIAAAEAYVAGKTGVTL